MNKPNLQSMEGQLIYALIPFFDNVRLYPLKLHKVEESGIWIESQGFTNQIHNTAGFDSSPRTIVMFLPWHQIATIWSSVDTPALSETRFGV